MKILKKTVCIFLSVVVLSLSVGSSYFSADQMQQVNATALVTVASVSLETIIEVVALLAVTGLAVGLISEWSTMDMQSALEDFHDWLHDNISVLNEIGIDGTSVLKEWAVAEEWTVIEGTGGSEDPDPSSDPSDAFGGFRRFLFCSFGGGGCPGGDRPEKQYQHSDGGQGRHHGGNQGTEGERNDRFHKRGKYLYSHRFFQEL